MSRIGWLFAAALLSACNPSTEKDPEYLKVTHLAGSASEENTSSSFAFSFPMPNLTAEERALHLQGDKDFELAFIVAQSVNHPDKDGLGPAFNQSNCEGCHIPPIAAAGCACPSIEPVRFHRPTKLLWC